MGAKARQLVEAAAKSLSPEEAAALLAKAMRLPTNQCAAVLEAWLRQDAVCPAVKDAVFGCLADDLEAPISRRLADALLLSMPQGGGARLVRWQKALRRFHNAEVLGVLGGWARDVSLPFERRAAALGVLGYFPSPASLEVLLSVHDGKRQGDWAFRSSANAALRMMFCLSSDPTPAQLAEWRTLAKRRDPVAFNLYLKDCLEAAVRAGREEALRYVSRIVKQEDALFDGEIANELTAKEAAAKAPNDKELAAREQAAREQVVAHLERMLGDPELAEVRLLALDLVDDQVALGRPVSEPVRAAMRACLTYSMPQVRAKSVQLLNIVGDAQSAQIVAARLAGDEEDHAEVLAACMRRMKRDPQSAALPAVRRLLDHPDALVASAATEALTAYGENKMLDEPMRKALAGTLLARMTAKDALPGQSQILLLGQVLDPADHAGWERMAGWLGNTHLSENAREAAALVLEKSTQPLGPLLGCVGGDAKLSEIALRAVRDRGQTREDAAPLVARVPALGAARDLWADALLGWAGRALPMDVDEAAGLAVKNGASAGLAVRMLGKVLARGATVSDTERAALLIHRGEIQEGAGDLAAALEDYDNAFPLVDADGRPAVFTKRMQLRLDQNKLADATALWAKNAAAGADPAWLKPPLVLLLAAIDKEGAKTGDAPALLGQLKQALAGQPAAALAPEVDALLLKWAPPPPVVPPVTAPVVGPVAGPTKDGVKEPAKEPAKKPAKEPAKEIAKEPVKNSGKPQAKEPGTAP